jgi:hypothetical protein
MSAIQGSTLDDFSAAPAPIGEGQIFATTPYPTQSSYVDGFEAMSTNGHNSPLPYSVAQNEGAASPNFHSAVQASRPANVPPSTASNRRATIDENRGKFRCRRCRVSFVQKQGLNRHEKDKHGLRNTCFFCTSFKWPSGRKYLFRRHLEQHHPEQDPEAVLAYF